MNLRFFQVSTMIATACQAIEIPNINNIKLVNDPFNEGRGFHPDNQPIQFGDKATKISHPNKVETGFFTSVDGHFGKEVLDKLPGHEGETCVHDGAVIYCG